MRVAVNFTIKNPGRLKVNPVVKINATVPEATKVSNKLIIGEKEYDGSEEVIINASDLGAITEVPTAANDIIGGISTGYIPPEGSDNIPVRVDEDGNAYVKVSFSSDVTNAVASNSMAIVGLQGDINSIEEDISDVTQDITDIDSDLTEVKAVTDPIRNAMTTKDEESELVNYIIIDGGSAIF